MGFRVVAIDTGSEKEDMCLNKLGAEEFVDFVKDDVVQKVKSVTGGLGAHAVILLAVSEKPFQQAAEV
jgi:alcohol dehydrogenase, propanol-preferring